MPLRSHGRAKSSKTVEDREGIEPILLAVYNKVCYCAYMPHRTKQENVQAVIAWRRRAKKRLISAFGGACGICGYNRCDRNLVLHHIYPHTKEYSFGSIGSISWSKIVIEARKCTLLCHNCHGEVHEGIITDLSMCKKFNESFSGIYEKQKTYCCVCGSIKNNHRIKTCSDKCKRILLKNCRINIPSSRPDAVSLRKEIEKHTRSELAKKYGVTAKTIRRWAHLYQIPLRPYGRPSGIRTHAELSLV